MRWSGGIATRVLLATVLLAVAVHDRPAAVAQQPAATVTGIVTNDVGEPVPLARVGLVREPWDLFRVQRADAAGRFVFDDVPAGAYRVLAAKAGYVELPWDEIPPNAIVQVAAGDRADVTLALPRGAVIEGVVRFDDGTPAPGTRVFPSAWLADAGRAATILGRPHYTTTNSRGEYRLTGLPSGTYVVSAHPDNRQQMQTSLALGESSMSVTLPVQYYPGVRTETEASPVTLAVADRRAGVDFVLAPVPVTDVSVALDMPPGGAIVDLAALCHGPDHQHATTYGFPQADRRTGQVLCPGMVQGAHEIFVSAAVRPDGPDRSARRYLSGAATVVVGDRPVAVTIVMDSGPSLSGRVQFVGAGAPPPLSSLAVEIEPIDRDPKDVRTLRWHPDQSGGFLATEVPPGRYVIRDSSGEGRMLVGATIAGQDVLDRSFDVVQDADVADVMLTYSSDVTSLVGLVVDTEGGTMVGRHVGVFPADPEYWDVQTRRYRNIATSPDGTYRFDRLPAGEYFLTLAPEVRWGLAAEPEALERLAATGLRVTVGPSGETRFDLRLQGKPRPQAAVSR